MKHLHMTLPQYSMVWFGVALSIAEIMAGTYLAPLGFTEALTAIVLGHIIGGIFLFGAGLIGGRLRQGSMRTTAYSFGMIGAAVFAVLNILQLFGWTGIMVYDTMLALHQLIPIDQHIWAIGIGGLIIVWIFIGLHNTAYVQGVITALLLGLVLYMGYHLASNWATTTLAIPTGNITFMGALELSIAMPLSWVPLISDYTRESKEPVVASVVSAAVYTVTSIAMYALGLGTALFGGGTSIITILVNSGLGAAGLIVIIFSTVTTAFVGAYSAGVSSTAIYSKLSTKGIAVLTTILGTIAAMVYPMDNIMGFLYFIGSIFTPMIGILLADFFINGHPAESKLDYMLRGSIWLLSFGIYHYMLYSESPIGATLPSCICAIGLTSALKYVTHKKADLEHI